MTVIRDPSSGKGADVTDDGHLQTEAITISDLEHASVDAARAFIWTSTYSATGGQEVFSLENTENIEVLHIESITCGGDAACFFTIFEVTSATAPGGTPLVAQNMDLRSGTTRDHNAFGNAEVTGGLTGNAIGYVSTTGTTTEVMNFQGALLLRNADKLAITAASSVTVYVTVMGHWG